jgi:hypothetical protein
MPCNNCRKYDFVCLYNEPHSKIGEQVASLEDQLPYTNIRESRFSRTARPRRTAFHRSKL